MITFIIPTIGRPTLSRTINCLLEQSNPNWNAIIVFDGVKSINYPDSRIKSVSIPKIGYTNCAGLVRNSAIKIADTEWIGFVDDDDTISQDYVEKFEEEIKLNPNAKCIIFRMKTKFDPDKVLPAPNHTNFIKNKVGISFAIKKDLNILFEPSITEDYFLLDKIRKNNHPMIISPYVTYFVREEPSNIGAFNRVIIN
jgi:glycosyltransferase involved in cell wall biosynthesis